MLSRQQDFLKLNRQLDVAANDGNVRSVIRTHSSKGQANVERNAAAAAAPGEKNAAPADRNGEGTVAPE
jgi:hypothetical protein